MQLHIAFTRGAAKQYNAQDIWSWFERKRKLENDAGEPAVKVAQLEMLRIVCQRLCDELQETAASASASEPLLWLLRGSPGTGKSEVLKLVKELLGKLLEHPLE